MAKNNKRKRSLEDIQDNKAYTPTNSFYIKDGELADVEVYPDNRRIIKPKLNEKEWQDYWGNKGAEAVNKAQNEAAPYGFALMSALGGNPIGAMAGIAGQIIGEEAGYNLGGEKGRAIGGLIGGLIDPETLINAGGIIRHPKVFARSLANNVDTNLARLGNKNAKTRLSNRKTTAPFEKPKPTKISLENAKTIPDAEWDYQYNKALQNGDMDEAQRLRDLHFVAKSDTKLVDANGMPVEQYHTVGEHYDHTFNEFNPNIEGTHSAIYTTPDLDMSRTYAPKHKTQEELIQFAGKEYDELIQKAKDDLQNFPENSVDYDKAKVTLQYAIPKEKYIENYIKTHPQIDRTKRLYVKTNNPFVIDGDGNTWCNIPVTSPKYKSMNEAKDALYADLLNNININLQKEGFETLAINPTDIDNLTKIDNIVKNLADKNNMTTKEIYNIMDKSVDNINRDDYFRVLTTRGIEQEVKAYGKHDAAIINDILDYGGSSIPKELKPAQVVESMYPENLKYSAAVTYDDAGNVIPLSKRDNFNLRDLRYGILPFILGSGALYNKNNKK